MSRDESAADRRRSASGIPARRQRVLMLAPHYREYCYRLASALSEHADVELAMDVAPFEAEFVGRPTPPAPTPVLRDIALTSPLDIGRVLREMARFRPTVLHLQEPSGLRKAIVCSAIVGLARRFCLIALTVHDPAPHRGRDARIAKRLDPLRRYIRRMATVTFVHGDHCLREYLARPESRGKSVVATTHGAILADRPAAPVRAAACHLLAFGRMEVYKGLEILCEALELLHAKGSDPVVHIAGRGPELDRLLDRLAKLPNIRVDNAMIPSDQLVGALEAADGVVLPYLEATQSGVLAATLGNGRFAIASRVGGLPDLVEDGVNGLLVPPGDAAALADAIHRAVTDPALCTRLGEGARRTATERLAWSRIAREILSRFDDAPLAADAVSS